MERFKKNRKVYTVATFLVVLLALGVGQMIANQSAQAQGAQAPKFEVDPFWPKPLPNGWGSPVKPPSARLMWMPACWPVCR